MGKKTDSPMKVELTPGLRELWERELSLTLQRAKVRSQSARVEFPATVELRLKYGDGQVFEFAGRRSATGELEVWLV